MADAPETLDMEVLCMQMIVDAGSAKSDYMEALQAEAEFIPRRL